MLLLSCERFSTLKWNQSVPNIHARAECCVINHQLVSDPRPLLRGCILIEWIPVSHSWNLELKQNCDEQ